MRLLSAATLLLIGQAATAQTRAITGFVVERESGSPVSQAVVRIQFTDLQGVTGPDGAFRISGVAPGKQVLVVEHIAFGLHSDTLLVPADRDANVQINISRQAIQLTPVVVEAASELDQRRRSTGAAFREITRPKIDEAQQKGFNLAETLRDGLVSAQVSGERRGGGYCIEYRSGTFPRAGGAATARSCRSVAVYMDGVHISNPGYLFSSMPLRDIERIEMLGPAEASTQYGLTGGNGVLLIETRMGTAPGRPRRAGRPMLTATDWSLEAQPYRWTRVSGGALLGNAAGLGLGLLLADQCLFLDQGIHGLRSRCSAIPTVGSGFLLIGLPAFTSTLAGRWGGTTERSQGRVMPAALLGTLTVAAGFLLYIHGENYDSEASRTGGIIVLTVGTPLVTTFSDRIFRALR